MPEPVADRLSALAALMRAQGARVGVGELLTAHRGLAAVDPASRAQAFHALCAALCSSHAEVAMFREAFAAVFAPPDPEQDNPLQELGRIVRPVMPRVGVPVEGIAIVIGVDRILDMCRTTVNVTGDMITATVVNRFESQRVGTPALAGR